MEQKNQNETQGINKKSIKFVPEIASMELSSKEIEKALNTNLQQSVQGLWSRVRYDKGSLYCEISVPEQSGIFRENVLAARGIKTDMGYELTDSAKNVLGDYLDIDSRIPIYAVGKKGRTAVVIQLNVIKTLETLMEKNPADYTYQISGVRSVPKTRITYITVSRIAVKKQEQV